MRFDGVDHEQEVGWDSNSSTLNNDDDDAKERRQCCAGIMENADARKAAKAERKAAKNQVLFDVITQEELAMVGKALHPESEQQAGAIPKGQGLADNRTIDENIAFNANTFKWGKLRQSVHAKKTAKHNGGKQKPNTPQQDSEILSPIFANLGISADVSKASKGRKSLNAKLRAAILGDLVAFENDQVETMQRMAGYWRYANKHTYNEMVRNNELWDWATGEKLPEIREGELDAIEEEDGNAEAVTVNGETEGQVPDVWDYAGFGDLAGRTALSNTPLIDSLNTNERVGRSDALTKQPPTDRDTKVDEEIESTRDRISKLAFSPGRTPTQTLGFKVPSPFSNDDDWQRLQAGFGDPAKEGPDARNGRSTRSPLSPTTPNPRGPPDTGFRGVKDTRVLGTAIRKTPPPATHAPPAPQPRLAPATPNTGTRDPVNRFSALCHETPAPRDEPRRADPPLVKAAATVPATPVVKTLAVHDERDGWETLRRSRGKRGARGRAAVALWARAAVNVHAGRVAGGKSFAAAATKGL